MNTLTALSLVGSALGVLTLPFLPALLEWRRPSDTQPLRVVREHDADIRSFAQRLRAWVSLDLAEALEQAARPGAWPIEVRWNEDRFLVLPAGHYAPMQDGALTHGVVALGAWALPAGAQAPREIWCASDVSVGEGARLRALVSEGHARLSQGAVVDRWLDAEGPVTAGPGVRLGRRAASQQGITLGPEVSFERLQAPCIQTDLGAGTGQAHAAGGEAIAQPAAGAWSACAADPSQDPALPLPGDAASEAMDTLHGASDERLAGRLPPWWRQVLWLDEARRHARIRGPVTVPAGGLLPCHLVVEGDLMLAEGAVALGAVKATGHLTLCGKVRVQGAAFGMGGIDMGTDTWCAGPLVSEGHVQMRAQAAVGTPDKPTTVSAGTLLLHGGVRIHGSIWSRQGGSTAAAPTA